MIIKHDGVKYDIVNWDAFSNKLLSAIGFQVVSEIDKQIQKMDLMGGRKKGKRGGIHLFGSYSSSVLKNSLIIESDRDYAKYIEYGTFEYWNTFGKASFPKVPQKKKMNMTKKEKKGYPKGMQPFAPIRRILFNQNKMAQIITKAVKSASR